MLMEETHKIVADPEALTLWSEAQEPKTKANTLRG